MSSGEISSTICQNKLKIFQKSGLSSQENLIDSFYYKIADWTFGLKRRILKCSNIPKEYIGWNLFVELKIKTSLLLMSKQAECYGKKIWILTQVLV